MKKVIIFILLFIFNLSFAHKDKIKDFQYKNINIRLISAYDFAVFNKIKIFGQYASKISDYNHFNDTIHVNFRHRLFNTGGNEVLIESRKFRNEKYLKIDIVSNDLSIEKFSKIIDFAIKNKDKLNKILVNKLDYEIETNDYLGKHKIINPETLENFYKKENLFINEIDLEVEIFNNEFFSCNWKNEKYEYYQKDKTEPIYTINDYELFSNQLTELGLVIFPNNREFFFIDNEGKISKTHELECSDNVFYFGKRDNYFWAYSHYMGQYYYLPIQDKLLKEVN